MPVLRNPLLVLSAFCIAVVGVAGAARAAAPEAVAAYVPTARQASSPVLVRRQAPGTVRVGQPFEYTITVQNVSPAPLAGVQLVETPAGNLTVRGTSPAASGRGPLTWDLGTLAAGASKTVTVTAVAGATGTHRACARVSWTNPDVCMEVEAVQPVLEIAKAAPAEALTCQILPVRFRVRNSGTGVARNVTVTDPLPRGLTTGDGQSRVTFSAGDLAPGQSREFEVRLRASGPGTYRNTATVTADGGLEATSNTTTTVVHEPKLKVTKTGPEMRYVGRPITFEITVANTGKVDVTNAVLTDPVPAGATFREATGGGQLRGGEVVWSLGTLAAGASKTVSLTVVARQRGTLDNVATARATCVQAEGRHTTRVEGIPAILLEVVDVADPIEVGANETYRITVTNQGSAPDTGIAITCELPPEQSFVSADGPTEASVSGRRVRFAPFGPLAPKAEAVFTVVVKGTGTGDVRFRTTMKTDQTVTVVEETESTHIYE